MTHVDSINESSIDCTSVSANRNVLLDYINSLILNFLNIFISSSRFLTVTLTKTVFVFEYFFISQNISSVKSRQVNSLNLNINNDAP